MKLLWLCNNAPGVIRAHISGKPASGVNWVDHVLSGLRQQGVTLRILCRGPVCQGDLDEQCSYRCFGEFPAHEYIPELEARFREELRTFRPDVIHSWGVEYSHALAMVKAAEAEGMQPKMVASIQGLCAVLAEHYTDGIPGNAAQKSTFRDWVRKDNILQQQEKFALRGDFEKDAVRGLDHVIGRTSWDRARTSEWNPAVQYHFCNETLRETFYTGLWSYEKCTRHRIFASSCSYPIKGFHFLLEAFKEILEVWPDATLTVTGRSFLGNTVKERLRRNSYEKYLSGLVRKHHLEEKIQFLGDLSAEEMKQAYLDANVFVLPSVMENSPNSLGEAMLLGVPCVASDVGGVKDMMADGAEGWICPPGDPMQLVQAIEAAFRMEERAVAIGQNARSHAQLTHDPETNLVTLWKIYREVAGK